MHLANLDWHDHYVCNNINTKVDIFNCKVLSLMDKHCPMITFVEGKPKPPWLTPVLKKLMYLNQAFCNFKNNNGSKQYYLDLKNYLSTAVKAEKAAFYNFQLNNLIKLKIFGIK